MIENKSLEVKDAVGFIDTHLIHRLFKEVLAKASPDDTDVIVYLATNAGVRSSIQDSFIYHEVTDQELIIYIKYNEEIS